MALILWQDGCGGMRLLRWQARAAIGMVLAFSMLTSCAVGPDFKPPEAPPVTGYLPPGDRPPGRIYVPGADIPPRWWELFHSEHLNGLIEMGIGHNADLQAAEAAVRVAQANMQAQRGALFPQVAANWNSSRQLTPTATLDSNAASGASIYSLHTAQVTVAYVLDIWGGTRRQIESHAAGDILFRNFNVLAWKKAPKGSEKAQRSEDGSFVEGGRMVSSKSGPERRT